MGTSSSLSWIYAQTDELSVPNFVRKSLIEKEEQTLAEQGKYEGVL
jgi:hypothetical protein